MHHWIVKIGNCCFNADTIIAMWSAMLFVIIISFIATRKLSLIPSKLQLIFEGVLGFFWDLVDSMIGHEGRKHIPLVASLFLFIVTANLMGQLPLKLIELKSGEIASATNDINVTAGLAIIVLIYYVSAGLIKKKGKFFFKGFSFEGIIEFFIEILDMITRPLTLALRLFGNILAGEILITAMIGLMAIGLPLPFMFFEILVAFIQAIVFTMLTTVYIATAINEE